MRPLLPPQSLWLRVDELFSELKNWPRVQLKTEHLPTKAANANLGFQKLPDLAVQAQQKAPLDALRKFLETFDGPVVFSVESEGRREALGELLARIKIAPQRIMRLDEASDRGRYLMIGAAEHGFVDKVRNLALICESDLLGERVARRRQDSRRTINPDTLIRMIGAAEHGFVDKVRNLALICESDLLGERVARRRQDSRRTINPDTLIRNLAELHIGQPVVHLEHGVGRYAGMTTLEAGGITGEYLMLTYANDAKLYVPVSSLHLISRYAGGAEENAPLHKLGGDAWSRARQKAAEKVRDVAAELLDIYAQRAAKEGFAFKHDREQYQLFCDSFPFEAAMRGHARGRKRRKKCVMWRRNCWISTRNAPPKRASRLNTIVSSISCSATASRLKPRRIRRRPLMRYLATCVSRWQWIVWCAAMLALVKQKWRCAPLSWQ